MTIVTGITYALIIAVENYSKPDFKKVSYAAKDAKDLSEAFAALGITEITCLIDKDATFTAISTEIKRLSMKATKFDRIMIFFAGHGIYLEEENRIVPVDAYVTSLKDSTIAISSILGYLKKSGSKKNILFLDCCHSGFEPGENIRDVSTAFLADELKYNYRNEEYCCGFASSKSNQKSISDFNLKNGVWSHYLIKVLKGDADRKIYEHGIVFSDKLQGYLNKEVSEFVKLNDANKRDQTPIIFGNLTDRFPIADLNELFNERERSKQVSEITFTNVTLLSEEDGEIKSLPGFQKKIHTIPTGYFSATKSFTKSCGAKVVDDEIQSLSVEVRSKLSYKRKQMEVWSSDGSGAIVTPDFTYSIEIFQSETDSGNYVLLRKLEGFRNSNTILEGVFNAIFSNHFEKLQFDLPHSIKIEELIDKIENLEDDKIEVHYSPGDMSTCTVSIKGLPNDIVITSDSISITSNFKTSPLNLISIYKETHKVLLANPALQLLGE